MKRLGIDLHSLSAQMIVGFFALVALAAAAVGLPAIWLIRDQMASQAWAQLDQGRRATETLYVAKQSQIKNLAMLTAQRPTLRELLAQGDQAALQTYLHTLQTGAELDRVLVCDRDGRPVAQEAGFVADTLCALTTDGDFHIVLTDSTPQAWLFAAYPVEGVAEAQDRGFRAIAAKQLDFAFITQMRDQTRLEHTLLVNGTPVASSLIGGLPSHGPCQSSDSPGAQHDCRVTFSQDGASYYAVRVPLSASGLETEIALPVTDSVAAQRRLVWFLLAGILGVAALGSGLGALLARRISQPLTHLARAATALSKGDLSDSVVVEARVREVVLVAQALEGARADLQRTLDQLRQEKAWADHLLEAIVEGIVTLDRFGRVTFFSQGAERITAWHRDEVIGRTCDQVFQPLETNQPFSQLIPPPGRRQKIPMALRDGRQVILAVTGARLLPPEGGDARVALVFRDVSEEEAVHRLLGHFLANVAHEFRTPLAAVAASVELLLDQAPDLSTAELDELLNSLHLGVLGLQTLVDNLLESASIEAGHFRVSPRSSDLSEIIAEAIRMTQPLLYKRNQPLTVELPAAIPVVRADPRRTVQVLINLLSNASKYGPDEAEIYVGASVSDEWVRVSVADQGPGILPEHRKDLFRRFSQLDPGNNSGGSARHKAQYGAGLGLSVVKAIVEAHGGQVGVDERPGGGSVFWFTLSRGPTQ
jgi:PAS domain S-box-containing protein